MTVPGEKIALFIDGANLYATAKSLGFDIDYKRLLREFQSRGYLLRAFYYTAVIEDQEYSSIRPLIDWLDYNGYSRRHQGDEGIRRPDRPAQGQRQHGYRACGRCDGNRGHDRSHGAVLRRRRFPLAGRGGSAQRRARHRGFNGLDPTADGRRRAAPAGRRLSRTSSNCRPRSAATRPNAAREGRPPREERGERRTRLNSCSDRRPRRSAPACLSGADDDDEFVRIADA